ncbi:hypothetical protein HDU97_001618 [Phlyctochytrium planicorne]|nr:hypothetical protein HDU97_001618 [Phlyctochytrium planicorne]
MSGRRPVLGEITNRSSVGTSQNPTVKAKRAISKTPSNLKDAEDDHESRAPKRQKHSHDGGSAVSDRLYNSSTVASRQKAVPRNIGRPQQSQRPRLTRASSSSTAEGVGVGARRNPSTLQRVKSHSGATGTGTPGPAASATIQHHRTSSASTQALLAVPRQTYVAPSSTKKQPSDAKQPPQSSQRHVITHVHQEVVVQREVKILQQIVKSVVTVVESTGVYQEDDTLVDNTGADHMMVDSGNLLEGCYEEDYLITEPSDVMMLSEYAQEIYEYSHQMELATMPKSDYMSHQTSINWDMRAELVNWMVEVHNKLQLASETLYFSINLMDRFLSVKNLPVSKLLLVGVTSLFIACKYEEVQIPSVNVMAFMVNQAYSTDDIVKAERFMLHMLQFDLGYPGPMIFLRRISKADRYNAHLRVMAKYFMEVTLVEPYFLAFPPSVIAASAAYLSLKILTNGEWTKAHVSCSGYDEATVFPCAKAIFHLLADTNRFPVIFKKYQDPAYADVSSHVQSLLSSE